MGADVPAHRLSIVHVIHHLRIGGMENGVVNLVNRLPAERFRHTIVCVEESSDFARRIERPDVEVIALHRSRIGVWRLRWQLLALLRRLRPDIVHTRNLSGLDALVPARLCGIRTLHSEHGFDVDNLQGTSSKPTMLRRLHVPLVRQYVCVSKDLRRLMVEHWGVPAARVRQICNGVDTDRFRPPERRRRDLLPEALAGEDRFVVGTVGRVQPVKDQATLLQAIAGAIALSPGLAERLALVVVGDGPSLGALRELAATLGIAGQCWFAGAREEVAALMQSFDLFVLPSLNEGISNTILEALASGLPVLASAVGGNPELVEDGVVGQTFAAGDPAALSSLIVRYADDADLCRRHGAAARQRAESRFSLETMVAAYCDVYESLGGKEPN
jgi:sugar transferase (PEP-CTERM/EpsH1 system associated)